jgi:phosphopantothenoylcysteine decarboxylase / phosphopantothenate---cysteine ligase
MSRILLGVSGGIAAYKALEVVRLATKAGHAVRVVQTPTAQQFVGAASFAGLTGAPALVDEFEPDPARGAYPGDPAPTHDPISHLALVANADAYLIAPASANTIAKLAAGLADSLVTTAALAARCPVLVAPAMNDAMWEHPATQANIEALRARGITVIDPEVGALGSKGEYGVGRLVEPAALLLAVEDALGVTSGPWAGMRVLVTAGGTREPIDSVRYVGNRSSGRMGAALAAAAAMRGASVTLIAANMDGASVGPTVTRVDVETAAQLQAACEERFDQTDVLLMAAAVADFRPADPVDDKIKKAGRVELELRLEATTDVLGALAARRRHDQTLIGFAAEHGAGADAEARAKLQRKGVDAIVLNDISRADIGFGTPENEVTIVLESGERHIPRAPKAHVADAILDAVDALRAPSDAAERVVQ